MVTPLLGLVIGVSPLWRVKFVPGAGGGGHIAILDCTKDLSLVGYSYIFMIDTAPWYPVAFSN